MADRFIVVTFDHDSAEPGHYGPGTEEACQEAAEKLREAKLPRGVTRRDVAVVPIRPLP